MMKTKRAFTYAFLILVSFVSIFPFLWMLSSSTNLSVDVTKGKLLPGSHLMDNMHNLLEKVDIVTALSNSAKVSISTTLLAMLIASLAGYGFEIYRSKAKDVVFNILLMSMMIPFAAIMIPLYRMFGSISNVIPWIGIDTLSSVVIPTVTTAFLIFFFRQSTKMFPKDLTGSRSYGWIIRAGSVLPGVYAYDENNLCRCRDHHIHVQLEQLPLASDCAANAGESNDSAVDLEPWLQLCTGLRCHHDRHCPVHTADCTGILPDAETLCSGHGGFG